MNKFLVVDTETGGLITDYSLLSVAGVVVEVEGKELTVGESFEYWVVEPVLKIDPEALEYNKIDLLAHIERGIRPEVAIDRITEFMSKHFEFPAVCIGHNVDFDLNFICKLISNAAFGKRYSEIFSHRKVDTSSILRYLYLTGRIAEDVSSSNKAFDYFGIEVQGRHTALGDAVATAQLFAKLLKL